MKELNAYQEARKNLLAAFNFKDRGGHVYDKRGWYWKIENDTLLSADSIERVINEDSFETTAFLTYKADHYMLVDDGTFLSIFSLAKEVI